MDRWTDRHLVDVQGIQITEMKNNWAHIPYNHTGKTEYNFFLYTGSESFMGLEGEKEVTKGNGEKKQLKSAAQHGIRSHHISSYISAVHSEHSKLVTMPSVPGRSSSIQKLCDHLL